MFASITLYLHSWLRWIVVLAGLAAIVLAILGLVQKRAWGRPDRIAGLVFTSAFDTNLLVGLIQYIFTSALTAAAFADMGAAMGNPVLRYFAVEHLALMLVALVVAHIGSSRVKKAEGDAKKHRQALIFYGIAFLLMLAAIPWPFLAAGSGRPWFRF